MVTSQRGKSLIIEFEGLVPYVYNDPVGHATFGVGHLLHYGNYTLADAQKWGTKYHQRPDARNRALRILGEDLKEYENAVRQAVKVPVNQCEFDAMVSLAFNIGIGAFRQSSVVRLLNQKKRFQAGLAFMLWVKASGQTLLGLVRRRRAERRLFRNSNCGIRRFI